MLALDDTQTRLQLPQGRIDVKSVAMDANQPYEIATPRGTIKLLQQGDYGRAEGVYVALLARDPADAAARAGLSAVRDGRDAATMPEEYRRIPDAPRVTRADLAALMMVRIKGLRRAPPGEPQVAVDIASGELQFVCPPTLVDRVRKALERA